jgi:hypothetical protein
MAEPRISKAKRDRVRKIVFVVLCIGCIPFFLWRGIWGEVLLKVYALTALVSFMILSSYWRSIREQWFWEAVGLILPIHIGIVLAVVWLNLSFPQIDRLPRVAYSLLTAVFLAEISTARRLIEGFRPEGSR